MTVHGEVETTYEVALDVDLATALRQAVTDSGGLVLDDQPEQRDLEATYFDTAGLRLAQVGITLRRRTGGDDAGWHLKVPAGEHEKVEKQLSLAAARHRVPAALRRLVRARTLDEQLSAVATIRTSRTAYAITGPQGEPVAEVADDRVEATRHDADAGVSAALVWREVEVELTGGAPDTLHRLDRSLQAQGLTPATGAARSKVLRVLGERVPSVSSPSVGADPMAGDVITAYLAEQVDALRSCDPLVRLDRPDSVHKMRVAARRLRSALKTFGPLLPEDTVKSLRDELKWLGEQLGPARDAEVMRARMQQLAEEEAASPVSREMATTAARQISARYRERHQDAVAALESERYDALVRDLVSLASAPPLAAPGRQPAADVLPRLVRRTYRALRRSVRAASAQDDAGATQEHEVSLHEARKKAKRARYAAEAVGPAFGTQALELAEAVEQVQADLGEHQDTVVLRSWLHDWALDSTPQSAFALGRWYAAEEERGRQAEERFARSWRAASKKKLRRWLTEKG